MYTSEPSLMHVALHVAGQSGMVVVYAPSRPIVARLQSHIKLFIHTFKAVKRVSVENRFGSRVVRRLLDKSKVVKSVSVENRF